MRFIHYKKLFQEKHEQISEQISEMIKNIETMATEL